MRQFLRLLTSISTIFIIQASLNVSADEFTRQAMRRQALRDMGFDYDPQLQYRIEVQRRRSELLQQYHPNVYEAEQDYARDLLMGDEVNLRSNYHRNKSDIFLREGQGSLTFSNGDKYVGEFHNGKKEGHGVYTFSNGGKYEGEFKNDLFEGQGVLVYEDGDSYIGRFEAGNYDGHGIYTFLTPLGERQSVPLNDGTTDNLRDTARILERFENRSRIADVKSKMPELIKLAEQGNAEAQEKLGEIYWLGRGVPRDYAKAFEWYKKASEQGRSDSEWWLGNMYYKGQGVAKNISKAVEWYKKAQKHGSREAKSSLSQIASIGECENSGTPIQIPGAKGSIILNNGCK
jgi:hypothetical protein